MSVSEELKTEFEKTRQELGFESTLEDIDSIFFVTDFIREKGYVSDNLDRQICSRITNTFMSWANYLHGLVMPNTRSMISVTETQMFSDDEKDEIMDLISAIMALTSRNTLIGLTKDKKATAEFIDESVNTWQDSFKPQLVEIMQTVNQTWVES